MTTFSLRKLMKIDAILAEHCERNFEYVSSKTIIFHLDYFFSWHFNCASLTFTCDSSCSIPKCNEEIMWRSQCLIISNFMQMTGISVSSVVSNCISIIYFYLSSLSSVRDTNVCIWGNTEQLLLTCDLWLKSTGINNWAFCVSILIVKYIIRGESYKDVSAPPPRLATSIIFRNKETIKFAWELMIHNRA